IGIEFLASKWRIPRFIILKRSPSTTSLKIAGLSFPEGPALSLSWSLQVYDVTRYMNEHPGGNEVLLADHW
ncbi:hypothetical protein B296_00011469, partial [Ensete ventricosum]